MARSIVFWLRKSHRYLAVFIGIQLLLWTVSGLYFSWNHITKVRGEHLRSAPAVVDLRGAAFISPSVALEHLAARTPGLERVTAVSVRMLAGRPVYEIAYQAGGARRHALADAITGEPRPPLGEREAVDIARADFSAEAEVAAVARITEVAQDSEYRGGDLPAYRVTFDHPTETSVYVSEQRGVVTARRNGTWRTFDFLWMFHIMDYETRDDINNILLQVLSILGLITVVSGYVLFAATSPLLRRRRRKREVAGHAGHSGHAE
jgi:hypothetical protein